MGSIAVCIPTLGHHDVINDVLSSAAESYCKLGIDLYYYDSSRDDETEKVICSFREKGFDNLYYVRLSDTISLNEKIERIFEGGDRKKNYDYVWPVKDRSFCERATLEEVIAATGRESDLILLGVSENERKVVEYSVPEKFYSDWGWLATSMDTVIFRKKSFFENYTIEKSKDIFRCYGTDEWYIYNYLFHKAAEISEVRIEVLQGDNIQMRNYQMGISMWERKAFTVWKDYWISINRGLPACYDAYKAEVIKKAASLPWTLGGIPRLQYLHDTGVLTANNYEECSKDWEQISDIPKRIVREIAFGEYDCFHDEYSVKFMGGKTVEILANIIGLLKDNKISIKDIPMEQIYECVLKEIKIGNLFKEEQECIIQGSIQDITEYCMGEMIDNKKLCMALQMLISYLLILNQK